MSRTIKFRAWDILKEVFIPNDVYAIVTTDFNAFGVMLKDWENYQESEYFYSHSQIVEQWTGLHDKNGKEIFENDVVRILYTDWPSKLPTDTRTLEQYLSDISNVGVIEWNNSLACFAVCIGGYYNDIDCGKHGRIEVIGNTHETPTTCNT